MQIIRQSCSLASPERHACTQEGQKQMNSFYWGIVKFLGTMVLISLCVYAIGSVFFDRDNYAVNFASNTSADCMLQCADMGNDRHCFGVTPSFSSRYRDSVFVEGACSCFLEKCRQ